MNDAKDLLTDRNDLAVDNNALKAELAAVQAEPLSVLRRYLKAHPREEATQKELDDCRADGYRIGLQAFAWWKDGVQYVGTSGMTLAEAIEKGEHG